MIGSKSWRWALVLIGVLAARETLQSQSPARDAGNDEQILTSAGIGVDGKALLQYFRNRTLNRNDAARIEQLIRKMGDSSFSVREQATNDLIAAGRAALPFLRIAVKDTDLEVSRRAERCVQAIESASTTSITLAATRLLATRRPAAAADVVLRYLPFADNSEIEEELLATLAIVGVENGHAQSAVVQALKDKNTLTRSAAGMIVGKYGSSSEQKLAMPLLRDKEPIVQLRAAQGLLDSHHVEAVPALIELIGNAPATYSWQAEAQLCQVAGEHAPNVSVGTASVEERKKANAAWNEWWEKNRNSIDLAKIELENRPLGLTLTVIYDSPERTGRIWEAGRDRKPRWMIKNIQSPIYASIVPGNRVLIAEYSGRRITERDFTGKILWEYDIPSKRYPVSCQRLANGNTFIATQYEVMEVDRQKNQVYSRRPGNTIVSFAQKCRNGQTVVIATNGTFMLLDDQGNQLKSIRIGNLSGKVTVEALPQGRFLIPFPNGGKVVEIDSDGNVVVEYPVQGVNAASKLPNGNILVCRQQAMTVAEITRAGKFVWEERLEGRPYWAHRR